MRNFLSVAFLLALTLSGMRESSAATLTFEDLNPAPALYEAMPTPYNGLTFTGWYYGPDTLYTPASGVIDLFTDYADPNNPGDYVITNSNNQITSANAFTFDGAWFSGYSGVTFELWNNGALVYTSPSLADAIGPDPYGPTFLASGYSGLIDKVVVSGVQGYYAMDDFTFSQAASAVPEPSTSLLLALGVAALGVGCRAPRRNMTASA